MYLLRFPCLFTCPCHSLKASFLAPKDALGSSYIFPTSPLDSAISARSPDFISGENIQTPRSGHQVFLLLLQCYCFQAHSGDRAKKYVYIHYMHTQIYFLDLCAYVNSELILIPTIPLSSLYFKIFSISPVNKSLYFLSIGLLRYNGLMVCSIFTELCNHTQFF